jgi:hypothetical protein
MLARMKLRKFALAGALSLSLIACASLPALPTGITQQHPGLAMNQGNCAEAGAAIALLTGVGSSLGGGLGAMASPLFGTIFGNSLCGMWNGAVNGQPAVATTISATTNTVASSAK